MWKMETDTEVLLKKGDDIMSKRPQGKCALCRKECKLTFEHIPPRTAYNSRPIKSVSGDKIMNDNERMPWEISGLYYTNQQQGMGKFSLCKKCNNNTGAWYGNDYSLVSHVMHHTLSEPIPDNINGIGIREVYPLRFIKQVISMFCSINNYQDERMDDLRDFVMNKTVVGLDKSKYKLCMYFTKSRLKKYAPLSVVIKMSDNNLESMALSEITAYPLGFVLYFNPTDTWKYDGIDITHFAECNYDYIADIAIPLCIKEMNDILPTFYRSQDDIKKCIEENKKWCEENEKL